MDSTCVCASAREENRHSQTENSVAFEMMLAAGALGRAHFECPPASVRHMLWPGAQHPKRPPASFPPRNSAESVRDAASL